MTRRTYYDRFKARHKNVNVYQGRRRLPTRWQRLLYVLELTWVTTLVVDDTRDGVWLRECA